MMRIRWIAMIGACLLAAASVPSMQASAAEMIALEINKGQMVHLDQNAATVMVADPTIADIQVISPRMVYVHAKKVGETSLYAVNADDETIIDSTITVSHNISKLEHAVKQVVPDADVSFKTVDGGLIMSGYVDSTAEAENIRALAATFIGKDDKLINMLVPAGSDQVTLMVKVAEVSRNELKQFGINLSSALNPLGGSFAFSVLQGRAFNPLSPGALGTENALFAGYNNGKNTFNSLIDALETQGLVSVLAEPSLTATSGKTANFLAGGEFPIPIVDSQGQVSVQYKPFGISLNFTPVVLSKDKISLTVAPEVSSVSSINSLQISSSTTFAIPSIQTRRAETSVELGSGQTFAIAGLLQNDRTNNINKFPGLGDLPVLGALFRSHNFQNNQSELVILVTPYIVRPVSDRNKIKSPLDGYTPPTDLQRLMMGKLYQEQNSKPGKQMSTPDSIDNKSSSAEPVPTLHGNGGFILE